MEAKYFCAEDWTGVIGLRLLRKIAVLAQQILMRYVGAGDLCGFDVRVYDALGFAFGGSPGSKALEAAFADPVVRDFKITG